MAKVNDSSDLLRHEDVNPFNYLFYGPNFIMS
jgi:hypothetical protein